MFDRPRNTALACLLFAAVAGYFVTGHYLYKVPIGLDESAFLLGEPLQALAMRVAPDLHNAASGAILLAALAARDRGRRLLRDARSVRAKAAKVDAGRREFLTGAGSGAGHRARLARDRGRGRRGARPPRRRARSRRLARRGGQHRQRARGS